MTTGDWYSPDDCEYEARWIVKPSKPLDEHFESGRDVQLRHSTGSIVTLRVYGTLQKDEPVMRCYVKDDLHYFLDDDASIAIIALVGVSTLPIAKWRE